MFVRIDRRRKMHATVLLKALGYSTHELLDFFYDTETIYIEKGDKTHLQPAQFVLDPDGRVRLAAYSSGPVGRLSAAEALGAVESARG